MTYHKKQKFSLRKYKIKVVSISMGLFILTTPAIVYAESADSTNTTAHNNGLSNAASGEVVLPLDNVVITEENGVRYIEISLPDNVLYNESNYLTFEAINTSYIGSAINVGGISGHSGKVVATTSFTSPVNRDAFLSDEHKAFLSELNTHFQNVSNTNMLSVPREDLVKAAVIINETPRVQTIKVQLLEAINDTVLDRKIRLIVGNIEPEGVPEFRYSNNNTTSFFKVAFLSNSDGRTTMRDFLEEVDAKSPTDKKAELKYKDKVLVDVGTVDFVNMSKSRADTISVGSEIKEAAPNLNAQVVETVNSVLLNENESALFSKTYEITTSMDYSKEYGFTASENMTYLPGTFGYTLTIGEDSVFKFKDMPSTGEITSSYIKKMRLDNFLENDQFKNEGIRLTTSEERTSTKWQYTIDVANNTITVLNAEPLEIIKGQTTASTLLYTKLFGVNNTSQLFALKDSVDSYADLSDVNNPKLKANLSVTLIDRSPEHANLPEVTDTLDTVKAVYRDNASGRNNPITITAKYQDENGNALHPDVVIVDNGTWSDDYATSPIEIENYEYKQLATNSRPEKGKAGFENGDIIFVYTPKLTTRTEPIPFDTTYVADDSLDKGQTVVETDGVDGVKTSVTNEVTKETTVMVTDPVTQVVKVGTKPTVTTKPVAFTVTYKEDDTLENGQEVVETQGQTGVETTTVTYTLDPVTGQVSANSPVVAITSEPVTQVVKVGTKPTVTTKPLDFTVSYKEDDTLENGQEVIETQGQTGVETTTVTYTLNPVAGQVSANEPVVAITSDPVTQVIKVGTKPTVTTNPVDFTVTYKEDDTLENGQEVIETQGQTGVETTTVTYTLDPATGQVSANEPVVTITSDPVTQVVKVGTKPTVTTNPIDFTVTYKEDDTLENGQEVIETQGQPGVETTTVTYTLDPATGQVSANEPVVAITSDPVTQVVKVGTKPTVTTNPVDFTVTYKEDDTLENGQKVIEIQGQTGVETTTVTYTLDPVTGQVSANVPVVAITSDPVTQVVRIGTKVPDLVDNTVTKQINQKAVKSSNVLPRTGDNHHTASSFGVASLLFGLLLLVNRRKKRHN